MGLQVKKRYPIPHPTRSHQTLPQRKQRREKRAQTIRRTTTSALVMTLIAVLGGIGYTWYVGQQKTATVAQMAKTSAAPAIFKPPKIASNAKVGVSVQTVSSPIKPGENASITVRTNPEASCTISVKHNKAPISDSGLAPKVADEFGIVSWAWSMPQTVASGKLPVEVACKNKVNSGIVASEIVVTP